MQQFGSLVLTTYAYYLAEVVDLLTEDRMENRAVFEALVEGIGTVKSLPPDVPAAVAVASRRRSCAPLRDNPRLLDPDCARTSAFGKRMWGPREGRGSRCRPYVLASLSMTRPAVDSPTSRRTTR